jgi:predicted transcriptional regulator
MAQPVLSVRGFAMPPCGVILTVVLEISILKTMEVHFSPDLETKLNRVAAENSSDTEGYVQQLVEHYLDHDAWFRQNVKKGLEQLDRGEYLTHEAVGERIERIFRS